MGTGLNRRRGIASLVVFATLIFASVGSAAETLLPPRVEVAFDGTVKPRHLPARRAVPISLHLSARIGTSDRTSPPGLSEIRFKAERHVSLDVEGIPACGPRGLPDSPPPWKKCADALVGRGEAVVELAYPEHRPIDVSSELAVYNGGVRGGVTKLWIHGLVDIPTPRAIVVPVKIKRVNDGIYGWEAVASVPVLNEGYGSVLSFNLALQKRVLEARCPGRTLQAQMVSSFREGTVVAESLIRPCRPSS